ncbi:MAG: hypothetical protein M3R35_01340, partial [Candidatus Eremiobacteraeota bacterium]|nr:hypothetical protein [Candidatus Eremiobacteraeota bacterium]
MNVELPLENFRAGGVARNDALDGAVEPLSGGSERGIGIILGDRMYPIQTPPAPDVGSPGCDQANPWNGIFAQLTGLMNEIMQAIGNPFGSPTPNATAPSEPQD